MTWISCDVEADGPIPGDFSMIALGAVVVSDLSQTFLGYLRPLEGAGCDPEALAISGFSREETEVFADPRTTMLAFDAWVRQFEPPYLLVADNNGFDWSFVNWYYHHFLHCNPFGFSSRNLNDIYHGLTKDARSSFKHLRKTKHDHNPVNDAMGNAEALIHMRDEMGFRVKFG